ncbi:MAG: SDR family oxidoreductase [Verrucomicrobiota bacterium]|nr:SDR family oxidoreductase [Limisphaera sp.]MDW8382986.1 SDR family oxidoreductase [Verrucomicrobiota bacterium]
MQILAGQTVLLTGASGGLGSEMARALAQRRVRMLLVAHPGARLDPLADELQSTGVEAVPLIADLRVPSERHRVIQFAQQRWGSLDLLINNAGVEHNGYLHELPESDIDEVLTVNLTAAIMLTRLVWPGMLRQQRGHVVNIASLAGKVGPALQEPYAASKAGLIAFTHSLRASYAGSGVSASVIVPGFVNTGIYCRLKELAGRPAPPLLAPVSPACVIRALFRAVERDLPEVIVTRYPVRPFLALIELVPAAATWLTSALGANAFFRAAAMHGAPTTTSTASSSRAQS